jgi:anti-sigma factor ChrR (cupin superfamily)
MAWGAILMDSTFVNGDRTKEAIVHASRQKWIASPEAGIERRLLERIGGEVALATSIVRYAPDSHFPRHVHELGEEFLVLDGTFCDENGRYPAGTYVRNPPRSAHAPFSDTGCVIFVKLRQMHPGDTTCLRKSYAELAWKGSGVPGIDHALLHKAGGVTVRMERIAAGAGRASFEVVGGEEIFVVDGDLELPSRGNAVMSAWDWIRNPSGKSMEVVSRHGALCWRKTGHLALGTGIRDS